MKVTDGQLSATELLRRSAATRRTEPEQPECGDEDHLLLRVREHVPVPPVVHHHPATQRRIMKTNANP